MTERPRLRDGPLHWLYYWLDLYGPAPEYRPANGKITATLAIALALVATLWWGGYLTRPLCRPAMPEVGVPEACTVPPGVTWPYVVLVLGIIAAALGADVFKAFLKRGLGRFSGESPESQ
jgi:hypothetical protein